MAREEKRSCHWWPLVFLVVLITGGAVVGTYFTKTGVFADSKKSSKGDGGVNGGGVNGGAETISPDDDAKKMEQCTLRNEFYNDKTSKCEICPEPTKYFAVFWESHVDGCMDFKNSDAFKYVTHIYWGFAEIGDTGEIISKFQGNDETLKTCMRSMRSKCVKQLASIGGAENRKMFMVLNSPDKIAKFGKSAAALVKDFGFDGIDIDDETGNALFSDKSWTNHGENVVEYIKSMRSNLNSLPRNSKEPAYTITWDEFPQSFDTTCENQASEWSRCYNPDITPLVDWINIMLYNVDTSAMIDNYLTNVIPTKWTSSIPANKIVLGACTGVKTDQGGCAYGPTPTNSQLQVYGGDGASKFRGAMLWTASLDFSKYSSNAMKTIGRSGNYGVGSSSRRLLYTSAANTTRH